ncbi:MAG TPA: sulfotransferase [Mucilaginibacter sp.]|nr:sulfotransferase [Mucilaginibacter sp.]
MPSTITEAEDQLNSLLPISRMEHAPPTDLLAAAKAWSQVVWNEAVRLGAMPLSENELQKGLKFAQHPVFICGVHRSGTTLVRNLLDSHPDLVVLPSEGTYYTNLEFKLKSLPESEQIAFLGMEWLRRLANPINQPPYWLLGRSSETISPYIDFARYLMAWWTAGRKDDQEWPHIAILLAYASVTGNIEAKFWVDKTPANERFLNRIWAEMPNAKIIHVIRDPITTLTSRKKMEPSITMRTALLDLKVSFKVAVEQSRLNDPRFLLVRYEELCDDPDVVIERMTNFLEIPVLDILTQSTVAGMPTEANSSFGKEGKAGQILKSSQHQQSELLSNTEQELIAAYIGDLATQLKYPLTKVTTLRKLYLRLKNRLW